jgi:hypothetical protein
MLVTGLIGCCGTGFRWKNASGTAQNPESKRRAKFQNPQFAARIPRQPKPAKRKNRFSNSFRLAIPDALV